MIDIGRDVGDVAGRAQCQSLFETLVFRFPQGLQQSSMVTEVAFGRFQEQATFSDGDHA